MLGLACLGSAAAMAASSWAPWQVQNEYDNAPRCAHLSVALAGGDCRSTTTAVIVAAMEAGGKPYVSFKLPAAGDRMIVTDYPIASAGQWLTAGSEVPVEFWKGHVTVIAGGVTAENPGSNPSRGMLIVSAIMVVIGVASVAGAIHSLRHPPSDVDRPYSAGAMNPLAASQLINH